MSEIEAPVEYRDCPYFGLSYYEEKWGAWFFGREAERNKIITNLRGARLTLLHADSGVGKSSLLRAGVAWRLGDLARNGRGRRGAVRYVPVVFSTWKDDPVPQLIGAIAAAIEPLLEGRPKPDLPLDRLDAAIEAAADAVGARLFVILDQFEEYFLYCAKEPTPERLADELARCINRPDLPANFLIAIREDAYAGLGDLFKGRIGNVYGNYLQVEYLDRGAAEDAIRKPVEVYNRQAGVEPVEIEPELVDAVLVQVRAHPGGTDQGRDGDIAQNDLGDGHVATPLLQLVMETVWERERAQGSRVLRLSTLQELKGAERIVDTHLKKALDGLEDEERHTAIDVFDHLVTPSGGKIAETVPDLAHRTGHSEEQIAKLMEKLDDARIVTSVQAPPGRDPMRFRRYEIFHDVLAPSINRAIGAREEQRLARAKDEAEERARAERRRARKFRSLAGLAFGLLIVAAIVGVLAYAEWRIAIADKETAQSSQAAASAETVLDSDPRLSALLALHALNIRATPQAETALRDALPRIQLQRTLAAAPPAVDVGFSPDGTRILAGEENGRAGVWDAGSHALIGSFGVAGLSALDSVSFSPNGKLIVTTYSDGTARIWDAADRRQLGAVLTASPGNELYSAAFDRAGTEVVTTSSDGIARIWNVATHALLGRLPESGADMYDAAFSPDGTLLVTASGDGTARVWNAATFRWIPPLLGKSTSVINSARFSPDGKQIVTAGGDGTARTWDVSSHAQLHVLDSRTSGLTMAVFSPDGRSVVTSSRGGTTDIWNASVSSSTPITRLKPVGEPATTLAAGFSPDGKQVVSAGGDGAVRIWDLASRQQAAMLSGLPGSDSVTSAAFSPDGRLAVTGTYGGTARVWDAATGQSRVLVTPPHEHSVLSVAFSPIDQFFLTAGANGDAYVWNASTGEIVSEYHDFGHNMNSIQFGTKPLRVLTAGEAGTAIIWNLSTEKRVHVFSEPGGSALKSASFSPDGTQVVTASTDGTARIWSATSGLELGPPIREPGSVELNSARFARRGTLIITASRDGTARTWDVRTHRQVGPTLTEPGGAYMTDAEFNHGGREIVTASTDGTARVWDAVSGGQLLVLTGHSGPVVSAAFSRDGARVVTASSDGAAKLWNAYPTGQQGASLDEPAGGDLITASFDRAGKRIVTASADGSARIWDQASQRPIGAIVEPGQRYLSSATFNPAGDLVLTASGDGTARVWHASNDQPAATLGQVGDPSLNSAVFSPDGRVILTSSVAGNGQGGRALVWDSVTHQSVGKPIVDPTGADLDWAAFSPDGRRIVTADAKGNAQIWEAKPDHAGAYHQLGFSISEPGGAGFNDAWFSPDGQYVVTCSDDGTARVWNAATSAEVAVVTEPGRSPIYNAVFGRHGWLMTSSADGYTRIWNWRKGRQLTAFDAGNRVSDSEFSADGRLVVTASNYGTARIFSTDLAGPLPRLQAIGQRLGQLTPSQARTYLGG